MLTKNLIALCASCLIIFSSHLFTLLSNETQPLTQYSQDSQNSYIKFHERRGCIFRFLPSMRFCHYAVTLFSKNGASLRVDARGILSMIFYLFGIS